MLTGELKKELIGVLQKIFGDHRKKRNALTDDEVKEFMTPRKFDLKFQNDHNFFINFHVVNYGYFTIHWYVWFHQKSYGTCE